MLASVVGGRRQEHASLLITANAAGTSARMVATFMLVFALVYMYSGAFENVQRAIELLLASTVSVVGKSAKTEMWPKCPAN